MGRAEMERASLDETIYDLPLEFEIKYEPDTDNWCIGAPDEAELYIKEELDGYTWTGYSAYDPERETRDVLDSGGVCGNGLEALRQVSAFLDEWAKKHGEGE